MRKAAQLQYEDIEIGAIYSFDRVITAEDIRRFADLTGDLNPLHTDALFGAQSPFHKNIAHGMFVGGLFSTLIGMYCPGERALYVSQTLQFRKPVFSGDCITVRGIVTEKHDSTHLITMKTEILRGMDLLIDGEARVKVV